MRMYRYLFFRLSTWHRRKFGEKDLPEFTAILALSALVVINFYNVLMLAEFVVGRPVIYFSRLIVLGIGLAMVLVHYCSLVRGDRLRQISLEFRGRQAGKLENTLMWAYPIVSVGLFLSLGKLRESGFHDAGALLDLSQIGASLVIGV